jgi:predicted dehydrogenase
MADRRDVLKLIVGGGVMGAAGRGLVIASPARPARAAPSDRIQVGCIGHGLIGKRHLLDFAAQPDVDVAAVCDVYEPRLDEAVADAGGKPQRYTDFRRMLDRKDIDAVVVSTPDHWHALMTILACAAGKDIYVEKPLTLFVREGEWMLRAAQHYARVVQVGTQQRSGRHYQRAAELVRGGHIGQVTAVRISSFRNIVPGFSRAVGDRPLTDTQWDLWLGPAPRIPFDPHRCLYHFRWFWDYSGGQTTNLLSHDLDIVEWIMNQAPRAVAAFARRAALEGIGETPDTFDAVFDYPGFNLTWSSREAAAGLRPRGLEIAGTRGTLVINRSGFEIIADRLVPPDDQIPQFTRERASAEHAPPRTEAIKDEGYEQVRDQFVPHVRNFLDCIRSRQQPISDLATSQRTAASCHLANIAMKVGRTVRWDASKQEIPGDAEAAALLTRPYRSPWDRELEGALPRTSSAFDE